MLQIPAFEVSVDLYAHLRFSTEVLQVPAPASLVASLGDLLAHAGRSSGLADAAPLHRRPLGPALTRSYLVPDTADSLVSPLCVDFAILEH